PAVNQQRQLMLAADQRGGGCTMQRLKPALGTAFSGHSPSVDLLCETFGPGRTEFLEPEQPTEEPSRRLADHQRTRLARALEWLGKIRCLADCCLLPRPALAD